MKNEAEVQNWIAMYDRDMRTRRLPPPLRRCRATAPPARGPPT